ncbi:hypothetical protein HDU82_006485 [Entophlyctis luteolus]|nr:hypothetical protein HDU82_006485 [Entophlyctis luteolus]
MAATSVFSHDCASLDTAPVAAIPIVDLSPLTAASAAHSVSARDATAAALVDALHTCGFAYLANHGIPASVIDGMFDLSRRFFALDPAEKERVLWDSPESNRGYVGIGREKLSELDKEGRAEDIKELNRVSPDLKEAFDIGNPSPSKQYKNKFPSPEVGVQCESFFETMSQMNVSVMSAVALGLGLDPDYFVKFINNHDNTLRLLHYPRVPADEFTDLSRRCGAHCDYGALTFLFQDAVGGLEVRDRVTGKFVRATPVPGTILVNVGDLLQRWTNDYLVSTEHRVVKPDIVDGDGQFPSRYSIAFFCDPNFDAEISTIEKFVTAENPHKYPSVNAGSYLVSRLSSTYV